MNAAAPTFLTDVLNHLQLFAQTTGVAPDDVNVRITLADGSTINFNGLTVTPPAAPGGLGMVKGVKGDPSTALIVRESHVIKINLDLASPPRRSPIGFHSSAT